MSRSALTFSFVLPQAALFGDFVLFHIKSRNSGPLKDLIKDTTLYDRKVREVPAPGKIRTHDLLVY